MDLFDLVDETRFQSATTGGSSHLARNFHNSRFQRLVTRDRAQRSVHQEESQQTESRRRKRSGGKKRSDEAEIATERRERSRLISFSFFLFFSFFFLTSDASLSLSLRFGFHLSSLSRCLGSNTRREPSKRNFSYKAGLFLNLIIYLFINSKGRMRERKENGNDKVTSTCNNVLG